MKSLTVTQTARAVLRMRGRPKMRRQKSGGSVKGTIPSRFHRHIDHGHRLYEREVTPQDIDISQTTADFSMTLHVPKEKPSQEELSLRVPSLPMQTGIIFTILKTPKSLDW